MKKCCSSSSIWNTLLHVAHQWGYYADMRKPACDFFHTCSYNSQIQFQACCSHLRGRREKEKKEKKRRENETAVLRPGRGLAVHDMRPAHVPPRNCGGSLDDSVNSCWDGPARVKRVGDGAWRHHTKNMTVGGPLNVKRLESRQPANLVQEREDDPGVNEHERRIKPQR